MYALAHPPATPNSKYISGSGANSPTNKAPGTITRSATSATSFRRSYIVCKTPPQQQPQEQESTAFYKGALEKAQGRIGSLEKTIEKLQEQHRGSLTDLHKEIARLQNLCSDISFVEIVHDCDVFLDDEPIDMRTPWSKKNAAPLSDDIDTESRDEIEDTKPYYVLLQQQRRKYQGFIERMNADNKRKQSEIEALRAELELVRDVLAVSGLDVDLVQLRGLVNGRDRTKELAARAKKAGVNVLPPIGAPAAEGGVTSNESGPGTVVLDARVKEQHAIMSQSSAMRADKIKEKPRDYHNANLDYHGRAFLYSVPPPLPPPSTESLAVSAEKTELNEDQKQQKSETVLPPINTKKASLPDILDPSNAKAASSWTRRLKGTQMLRQKTWQSLNK